MYVHDIIGWYLIYIYLNHTEAYIFPSFIYSCSCRRLSALKKNNGPGDDKWRQEEAARLLSRSALEDLGEWFQPAGATVTSTCRDEV